MAGRPPLAIGTHGNISAAKVRVERRDATGQLVEIDHWKAGVAGGTETLVESGSRQGRITTVEIWRAKCRYRDFDGVTRPVTATGTSEGKARQELLIVLRDRSTPSGELITSEMTVKVAAEKWLATLREEGGREESTIRYYERLMRGTIGTAIGSVRMRELSAGRIERVITAQSSASTRKKVKVVLGMLCDTAVRDGAIPVNPVRATSRVRAFKKDIVVLAVEDLEAVRRAVRHWMERPRRGGPKPNSDMADIVDLMLATACRIGEVLAVRWDDIEGLWEDVTVIRITGTIKKDPGKPTYRKPRPKSDAGVRGIVLPPFAVEMLRRRHTEQDPKKPNHHLAVFPTRNGTWHQVGNVERRWRTIRKDTGFDWVTPHVFRKTVLTLIDKVVDLDTAARLGGHGSGAITKEFYIAPDTSPVDVASVVEAFAAPRSKRAE